MLLLLWLILLAFIVALFVFLFKYFHYFLCWLFIILIILFIIWFFIVLLILKIIVIVILLNCFPLLAKFHFRELPRDLSQMSFKSLPFQCNMIHLLLLYNWRRQIIICHFVWAWHLQWREIRGVWEAWWLLGGIKNSFLFR